MSIIEYQRAKLKGEIFNVFLQLISCEGEKKSEFFNVMPGEGEKKGRKKIKFTVHAHFATSKWTLGAVLRCTKNAKWAGSISCVCE